jgi:uncharacterized membrane protein YhaH (DUF805 family)
MEEDEHKNTRMKLPRWLSFSGRANRREYWAFAIVLWSSTFALHILLPMSDEPMVRIGELGVRGPWYSLLPRALLIWAWLAVNARRLHDCGQSAVLLLLGAIPLVSVFLCGLPRGDAGRPNRFGPPPGPGRGRRA